jgi:hypothetical protein
MAEVADLYRALLDAWNRQDAAEYTVGMSHATWHIVQFQNTPAQFHGRPEAGEALTSELRALV